ncbi:hypothetical protein V1512DRAFT_27270 [Lipomyces arxii]|uniref:uncharacterized protein n=1 Tax=Lipomyces arxii TaxID=56418 RepID=UPI0034CF6845
MSSTNRQPYGGYARQPYGGAKRQPYGGAIGMKSSASMDFHKNNTAAASAAAAAATGMSRSSSAVSLSSAAAAAALKRASSITSQQPPLVASKRATKKPERRSSMSERSLRSTGATPGKRPQSSSNSMFDGITTLRTSSMRSSLSFPKSLRSSPRVSSSGYASSIKSYDSDLDSILENRTLDTGISSPRLTASKFVPPVITEEDSGGLHRPLSRALSPSKSALKDSRPSSALSLNSEDEITHSAKKKHVRISFSNKPPPPMPSFKSAIPSEFPAAPALSAVVAPSTVTATPVEPGALAVPPVSVEPVVAATMPAPDSTMVAATIPSEPPAAPALSAVTASPVESGVPDAPAMLAEPVVAATGPASDPPMVAPVVIPELSTHTPPVITPVAAHAMSRDASTDTSSVYGMTSQSPMLHAQDQPAFSVGAAAMFNAATAAVAATISPLTNGTLKQTASEFASETTSTAVPNSVDMSASTSADMSAVTAMEEENEIYKDASDHFDAEQEDLPSILAADSVRSSHGASLVEPYQDEEGDIKTTSVFDRFGQSRSSTSSAVDNESVTAAPVTDEPETVVDSQTLVDSEIDETVPKGLTVTVPEISDISDIPELPEMLKIPQISGMDSPNSSFEAPRFEKTTIKKTVEKITTLRTKPRSNSSVTRKPIGSLLNKSVDQQRSLTPPLLNESAMLAEDESRARSRNPVLIHPTPRNARPMNGILKTPSPDLTRKQYVAKPMSDGKRKSLPAEFRISNRAGSSPPPPLPPLGATANIQALRQDMPSSSSFRRANGNGNANNGAALRPRQSMPSGLGMKQTMRNTTVKLRVEFQTRDR